MFAGARTEGRAPPSSPVAVDRAGNRRGSRAEEAWALQARARVRAPVSSVVALGMNMLALAPGRNRPGVDNTRRCIAHIVDGKAMLTASLYRWFWGWVMAFGPESMRRPGAGDQCIPSL